MPTKDQCTIPQSRNTVQVPIHLLPAELAELDALAAELAEPGRRPNRSMTVRKLLDHWFGRSASDRLKTRRPKGR
jgi:hypothetical protein